MPKKFSFKAETTFLFVFFRYRENPTRKGCRQPIGLQFLKGGKLILERKVHAKYPRLTTAYFLFI